LCSERPMPNTTYCDDLWTRRKTVVFHALSCMSPCAWLCKRISAMGSLRQRMGDRRGTMHASFTGIGSMNWMSRLSM
jgi:hypothetical protein